MTEVALSPSPTSLDTSALTDGQTADASDPLIPFNDAAGAIDEARTQVAVSENDTHVGQLNDKNAVLAPIIKAVLNPGANEDLQLRLSDALTALNLLLTVTGKVPAAAMNSTSVPSGYVPTANGSDGVSFAASGGGGAQPVDITITAGGTLAERDIVFVDPSDDKAYRVDIDAVPVKISRMMGVVNQSGGIASSATGTIRLIGEVSGFSGLTPFQDVWASTTAGGYTQTKPTVTAGGGQKAIARIGYAVSVTAVMVLPPGIAFHKREALVNNGTLTLEHIPDAERYTRTLAAQISSSIAGPSATSYADSNRDDRAQLRGPSGAGGTTTPSSSANTYYQIGAESGTPYWLAQSFQINSGKLSQITFTLQANGGTPTGTITWELREDNAGNPTGTVLVTGTISPIPSSANVIKNFNGMLVVLMVLVLCLLCVLPALGQGDLVPAQDQLEDGPRIVYVRQGEPTVWDLLPVLSFAIVLVVMVGYGLVNRRSPALLDQKLADYVDTQQHKCQDMEILEWLVQKHGEFMQDGLKLLGNTIVAVAPYIPGRLDTEVGEFLQDIAEPGPQEAAPVPETAQWRDTGGLLLRDDETGKYLQGEDEEVRDA